MNKKLTTTSLSRVAVIIITVFLILKGTNYSNAAVITWTGGGNAPYNWSDPNNWAGGVAPSAGDDLVFDGTTGLTNINDYTGAQWGSITFAPTAGQFFLQGENSMQMGTGGNAGFTNNSAYVQTIDIETRNNRTVTYDTTGASMVFTKRLWDWRYYKSGTNDLILRQSLDGYNGQILGINAGRVVANSVATNGGPWGHGVQINTGGTLLTLGPTASFNTDYRADVTMSGGLWQVQNTNELGEPYREQTCMLRSSDESSAVENGSALGPIQLVIGEGSGARVGAFDGMIRDGTGGGALAIILTNSATYSYWRLGGSNSYSGDTIVAAANTNGTSETRLIVNGSNSGGGSYYVSGDTNGSKAYLCGSGFINANEVNVGVNAFISPGGDLSGTDLYNHQGGGNPNTGTFTSTTATLTITNNVTLSDSSSTLEIQLGGATAGTYDRLAVEGSGTFFNNNANLEISVEPGYFSNGGDQFTLVQVHGTDPANNVGQFASLNGVPTDLSQGAEFTINGVSFKISYRAEGSAFDAGAGNGNDIMIQAQAINTAQLTWRGNGTDNNWDNNATSDWWDGANLVTFANGNIVTFDDTGDNSMPVNLVGDLSPLKVTVNASKDYAFSGSGKLTGAILFTKTNAGTLSILTDNDFSGATVIDGGTLQLGNNTSAGSILSPITVSSNGVLVYDRSDNVVITNEAFSGTGGMVHSGDGQMIIAADLSTKFTGQITNSGGVLQLGDQTADGNSGSIGGTIHVSVGHELDYKYYANGNFTIPNSLSGNGSVVYDLSVGDSARTIGFASTTVNSNFNGTVTISPYTRLEVTSAAAEPGGQIVVQDGGSFYSHVSGFTNMNPISIVDIGPGSSVDTPQGKGALRLGNAWGGPITLTGNATIGGGTATILGAITDGGNNYNLTYAGNTIRVAGPSSGANTYGDTVISEDYNGNFVKVALTTVQALNSNPFSANPVHMIGDAQLQLNGNNLSIANLIDDTFSLGGTNISPVIANGSSSSAATLTLGSDNNDQTFTGKFINGSTQSLGLTKVGAGKFTVNGDSTSTGPVTVLDGTLALAPSSSSYYTGQPVIGSGSFSNAVAFAIASVATLDVSGRSDGTLTLSAGQTLKHSGSGTGAITVTGNVNIGNGILQLAVNHTGLAHDGLAASGSVTYSGTLVVTNIGAELQAGDAFQLFASGVSGFTAYDLPTNDYVNNVKYTWNNTVSTDGKITVASVGMLVNTNPTNIVATVSNGAITLQWPADHTGWMLQSQTNSLAVGLSTNWVDVEGSASTNKVSIPIGDMNGAVFYRLVLTNAP